MASAENESAGLLERRQVGVYRQGLDGRLVDCNEACARILGYDSPEELLRTGAFDYFNASDQPTIAAALKDLGTVNNLEICLRRRNGTLVWVTQNIGLIPSGDGDQIEGVLLETTEQRLASERIEYQVTHDPVSGLPNRSLYLDRLMVALAQSQRRERPLAVCVVDLDHFDLINATFGRGLADRILKVVGDRLVEALRLEDTVARFGSDEFSLIIVDVDNEVSIASIAQRLLDTISHPIVIETHEVRVNASIGISMFPGDGADPEMLLKNADAAMYRAKDVGRNTWQFYQPEVNARAFERQMVVRSLRNAIRNEELVLHYQPQINVQTGQIECLEALLRWNHPELGIVNPEDFLPAAEQGGLIPKIGEWVIRTTAKQARLWAEAGLRAVRIAVNLSWRQFQQPDLIRRLGVIILEEGIDPSMLELEISERAMQHSDRTMTTLLGLKNLGVRLALDDYGTGRSSLADLKRLPFDTIKIDPSYVQNVTRHLDDAALVQAVITMARAVGLRVVAEGVETKDQLSFLRDQSCVDMQGFFFGKPLPAFGMEGLLKMQH
ncbi:MAG TPA: EAL domain-containing protein [Thermoanaerobaculia bacterium]|nr:EAL domain-containing protein [Thermoanaerobaculia bacterium]